MGLAPLLLNVKRSAFAKEPIAILVIRDHTSVKRWKRMLVSENNYKYAAAHPDKHSRILFRDLTTKIYM